MTDEVKDEVKDDENKVVTPEDGQDPKPNDDPKPGDDPKPNDSAGDEPNDPEEEKENKGGDTDFDPDVWGGSTGSEVGDSVIQLLHESGVSPDDAKALMYDAIKNGKPEEIDRDALVEKVGKANATLIMSGVKGMIAERQDAEQAAAKVVYDAAGGEEAWKTVLPWITENIAEEDLNEYRAMIDAGGKQATLAVKELVGQYNADPKTKKLNKQELIGDNNPKPKVKGISRREYGDELNKLSRLNQATPEALAALRAKRKAGQAQGL